GDVWIGMTHGTANSAGAVTRWERATETLHPYGIRDGLSEYASPAVFAEDKEGNIWVGLWEGGLLRYRGGRFRRYGPEEGAPAGVIQGLYLDSRKRLWVASSQGGASRIDDSEVDHPVFHQYTTNNGLATNNASCFTEDSWGRIYVGTSIGVDRLDTETGGWK